jgi:hypothetical protein
VPEEVVPLYRRRGEETGNEPGTARLGEASERARVARPSPFTNFTSGPPLVHPLSRLRFSLTFNAGLNP